MPGNPTSGTDRVNTAFEVQSVSFDREVVNSDHSLSVAVAHLESCASKANMMIHDVPRDRNCLYWSILYQPKARGACTASVSELREMTAAYLESHSDVYSYFVGESIPATNPRNADTEAPDDDDAQISLIPDPYERSQARWFKYLERIRHGAWGDNLCIATLASVFLMTVNVYTATQAGCTVNPITPIEGNSLFDISVGLIMQWHFVGLDEVITAQSADLSQCEPPRACCDSDMCSDSQSPKDSSCCDSDNEKQSADDIEIDEDTFQKGDQYSRQITGGPSASMMSVKTLKYLLK